MYLFAKTQRASSCRPMKHFLMRGRPKNTISAQHMVNSRIAHAVSAEKKSLEPSAIAFSWVFLSHDKDRNLRFFIIKG